MLALLRAICRRVERSPSGLTCDVPFQHDEFAFSAQHIEYGSFSVAGSIEAVVAGSVGPGAYRFRYFLLGRQDEHYTVVNTTTLEGELEQQAQLRGADGVSVVVRAVTQPGFPGKPVRVEAISFRARRLALATLAWFDPFSPCSADTRGFTGLKVSGQSLSIRYDSYRQTTALAERLAEVCDAEDWPNSTRAFPMQSLALRRDYDGAIFRDRAAPSNGEIAWFSVPWELESD